MVDKNLRLLKGSFGEFIRNLQSSNKQYQQQINFFRTFSRMCERSPQQYRMKWVGRHLFYEFSNDAGNTWETMEHPNSNHRSILDYIIDERRENNMGILV